MSRSRIILVACCLAAITSIPTLGVSQAQAQRRAAPPERRLHPGKYPYWSNQRATRSMRHARDYSRDLYHYSREVETVRPEVAKSESAQIGRNIEYAQKEMGDVRKSLGSDQQALASLELIEKHLAQAAEMQKTLHQECSKTSVDGSICVHCCNAITKELEKAMAEHAALTRQLNSAPKTKLEKEGK